MNPTRDEILRELIVQTIRGILVSDPVLIKSLLKYDEEKDYSDPLSIPTVGYVEFLLNGGSGPIVSGVIHRSFIIPESEITDGSVSLAGKTNEQGDQIIPSKAVWSVDTEDGSAARYNNNTQIIDGIGTGDIQINLVGLPSESEGGESIPLTLPFTLT